MKKDIVITGVGGQGTVLASRILGKAALKAGYEVRTSETIGMAQREGSVVSQVRFGDDLTGYGPLIPANEAELLISFELAETVKGIEKLKSSGTAVFNSNQIIPVTVSVGDSNYEREEITDYLKDNVQNIYKIDAAAKAKEAGSHKSLNVVMLGAAAGLGELGLEEELLLETILELVPSQTEELNRRAFRQGLELSIEF